MSNSMARSGEWTAKGNLPNGAYLMQVIRMRDRKTQTNLPGFEFMLRLQYGADDTNLVLHWYVAGGDTTRWIWGDLVDEFEDMPDIMDRVFLVYIRREKSHHPSQDAPTHVNRVMAFLAEVTYD
jgi:hypothetical protein